MCKILKWRVLLKRVTEDWKVPRSAAASALPEEEQLEMALPAHGATLPPARDPRGSRLSCGKGEAPPGLRRCLLQTPSEGVNTQLPGDFSQEGRSTVLFRALFQPDTEKFSVWAPARLCSKTPPLGLQNCFISAPTFPQPPAQPSAVGAVLTPAQSCSQQLHLTQGLQSLSYRPQQEG